MKTINVIAVKAFSDNYIWLAQAANKQAVAIVDPGDAKPVMQMLAALDCQACAILVTHHHYDHIDGIEDLVKAYNIPVYAPVSSPLPSCTQTVSAGDSIELDNGLTFSILEVPGHTLDHIAYLGHQSLFCGDTLFGGGCGRLLGGTSEQMYHSLQQLAALPDDTQIYCAHEYTLANLEFAQQLDSDNLALTQRIAATRALRQQQQSTLPSTIGLEKQTNPFLRCSQNTVSAAAQQFAGRPLKSPQEVFKTIRFWKDTF